MIGAALGGLGAAVIWSVGIVFASKAARAIGSLATLAWVMLIGLLLLAAVLPWSPTHRFTAPDLGWLALGGTANVAALLLIYRALRSGQMGVVMPIVSTEGGIAAVLSILTGQTIGVLQAAALAVTVLGVACTSASPRRQISENEQVEAGQFHAELTRTRLRLFDSDRDRRAALLAILAAVVAGLGLFGIARAGELVPPAWAALPPRIVGVIVVTIPLAVQGRLLCPRGNGIYLVWAGTCEVSGFILYALAAKQGIAVAAVLASLTGCFGAIFGRFAFGERLSRTQRLGVVLIFVGVSALTAVAA